MTLQCIVLITFLMLNMLVPYTCGLPENITIGGIFSEDEKNLNSVFQCVMKDVNDRTRLTINPRIYISSYDSVNAGNKACELIKKKAAAIFGPQNSKSSSIVRWTCEDLGIPNIYIFSDWSKEIAGSAYINLHPDPYMLAQAYASVVKKYLKWKSFTILYEDEEGLQRMQEVLKIYKPEERSIVIKQLSPDGDHRVILKDTLSYIESHLILDCATDHVLEILNQAEEVGVLNEYHSFFVTSLDTHTLDLTKYELKAVNVTSLRLVDPTSQPAIEASEKCSSIDLQNLKVEDALMYDAVNLFINALIEEDEKSEIHVKRISCDKDKSWAQGPNIISTMKQMSYDGLTGHVAFDDNGRRIDFSLDILEVQSTGLTKRGSWNPRDGAVSHVTFEDAIQEVETYVRGKEFRVVSRTGPPYLVETNKKGCVGNECYEGFSMDLISEIARVESFKNFTFFIAPDNGYGNYDKEKKDWNGLIKQILVSNADLGICDLAITAERRDVVDFSTPFMDLGIKFIIKKPPKEESRLFRFLDPFKFDVWMYMATGFLGVSLVLYALARISPYEWGNPHLCDPEPEEMENSFNMLNCLWFSIGSLMGCGCDILPRISPYEWRNPQPFKPDPEELENNLTLNNCLWHNIGSLMQMGSDIAPQAASTRVLAGMWWFFALIMIASYTANLAAFLTANRIEGTIKSVEHLADQSKIKYGTILNGATYKFFQKSNTPLYQKMFMTMEEATPNVFTENNEQGVKRVQKGNYAFFMESTTLEYQKQMHCDIMDVGDRLDNKGYGIAMPLDSPYRSIINRALLALQENGTVIALKKKWWSKGGKEDCDTKKSVEKPTSSKITEYKSEGDSETPELGLMEVGGVFLVVVAGGIPGFIFSLIELMWKCRKIAVEEKITPCEAMMSELKFALNMSNETKPTNLRPKSCANSEESA